jgi:hypothetical protein
LRKIQIKTTRERTGGKMEEEMATTKMVIKNIKTCFTTPTSRIHNGASKKEKNFSKVFYVKQKECPRTADGELICMKFLVRGLCDKSCNRAHSISKEDSKKFDKFVADCREAAAAKKDF